MNPSTPTLVLVAVLAALSFVAVVSSFLLGAWVYHRAKAGLSPVPPSPLRAIADARREREAAAEAAAAKRERKLAFPPVNP